MQFQGRIYKIFPIQSGTSQRGEWTKQDFIFEYFEQPTDRYADRVLLSIMNDRIKEYDLHEGDTVIIGFSHTTREYQGRCFNDIRLYHFEKVRQVESAERPQTQTAQGQLFPPQTPPQTPVQGYQGGNGYGTAASAPGGDEFPF